MLVDGRRLGVGSPNTAITQPAPDLDQIPAGLVDRVEVVTGGASAAYGSDAIAGVVNFIMAGNAEYISRDSIKHLSADLAAFGFVRIDRSILLNIRAVHFAEPVGHGTLAFTLISGACLHSSRTYRETILRVLPWHHCRAGADL